ncbi:MAG TPA: thioredoxin domain-containing protein [Candidatus Koribacter sp.]|jgi:protein-disulfide isomerase
MLRRISQLALFLAVATAIALAGDTSPLRPPKGARIAIIVFEDLQCPDCARAAPLVHEAAKTYKIPLIQHDFPLPQHNWSFDAAVDARWFDSKSLAVGDAYRSYIFQRQPEITPENLRGITEKFASEHKLTLPMFVDPKGELAAKVKGDYDLGQRVGIVHTPTLYVVSNTSRGTPFVEIVDRSELYSQIDAMLAESDPVAPAPKSSSKH